MSGTTFRDSIREISPPWLTGDVGGGLSYACGLELDALAQWAIEGVKARMPGVGTPDALYLIGRDRQIERGPGETDAAYVSRLSAAFDTWATAGAGPTLLREIRVWFAPSTSTPVRLVSNAGVWHTINLTTNAVTKTVSSPSNWNWDAFTSTRWWRGWVIIDSSTAPWTRDLYDLAGLWGDGGTWGSDADVAEVAHLKRIAGKWKPANMTVMNVIVTFSATLFEHTDTSPPNPSGGYGSAAGRLGVDAIFWGAVS